MALIALEPSQILVDLVGTLGGQWHGKTAMCRCPAHNDSSPSLSLRQGERGILVTCFAGCDREDVLRELGRITPDRSFRKPNIPRSAHRSNVGRLWSEARAVHGTLAERYLASRGLDADLKDVRYHARCPHGAKPQTRFEPALLVAVRDHEQLRAIQRIFLDPATASYTSKLMLGTPKGAAWRGGAVGDILAIAEGFETAAAYSAMKGTTCWAALGARRLDQIDIPPGVKTIIVAEDADPEGRRAARKAWAHYQGLGYTMRRDPPPAGASDWAEALGRAMG